MSVLTTRIASQLFPFTQSGIQKQGISELAQWQRATLSVASFNLEGISQQCFPQAFLPEFLPLDHSASFYASSTPLMEHLIISSI